jgi:hypothetical protein
VVPDLARGYRQRSVFAVENAPNISRRGRELLVVVVGVRARPAEKQDRGGGNADRSTQCRNGVHSMLLPFLQPELMPLSV